MRRRQVLTLAGASALPFAGCVGSSESQPEDRTRTVGESTETADGRTVTVRTVRISKLVPSTSVGSPTHVDVACLPDHQFAVAEVEATDADGNSVLSDIWFALVVDGVQYPRDDQHWYWAFPRDSPDGPGFPAFPAPVSDAADAAIIWPRPDGSSVRWELPPDTVDSLGRAPAFSIRSFETPESVSRGDHVEASFTVANEGDRDGRYIAELGAGQISDHPEVTVEVSEGAERTHTERLDPYYARNEEELEVTLDWGCNRRRRSVSVTD